MRSQIQKIWVDTKMCGDTKMWADTDVQFTADFIPRFIFELVGGSRRVPKQPFDK